MKLGPIINEEMTVEEVREADTNPVEFFYPYLKRMLGFCAYGVNNAVERQRSALRWSLPTYQQSGFPKETELNILVAASLADQCQFVELGFCLANVKKFCNPGQGNALIDDLEELMKRVTANRDSTREEIQLVGDMLNRDVSNLAILESQKSIELANVSIEQAVSVKREYPCEAKYRGTCVTYLYIRTHSTGIFLHPFILRNIFLRDER
jgi:hypothetical protein